MEIVDFNKVLSKALDIVDVGIKKGYFDENRKEELNNKLVAIFNNGIVYDLPGTAVYGMYSPSEKKLYFNAKVFKTEEEAQHMIEKLKVIKELQNFAIENRDEEISWGEDSRYKFYIYFLLLCL